MSFESILTYVGRLGRYQMFIFAVLAIHIIIGAFINVGIVFIAPKLDHWCSVPELEGYNLTQEEYREVVAPSGETCQRYDLNFSQFTELELLSWNQTLSGMSEEPKLVDCDQWRYDKSMFSYTATEQYQLVCGRSYLISIVSSVFMCGLLVGSVTSGAIADRFGRRPTFLLVRFLQVLVMAMNAFAVNFPMFAVARFLAGANMIGGYAVGFVLCMEMLGTEYRTYASIVLPSSFSIGIILLAGVAYLITSHVWLQLAFGLMYIPATVLAFFVVPESPRWLIARERHDEAYTILQRMARYNKRTIPDQATTMKIIAAKDETVVEDTSLKGRNPTIIDLVRTPRLGLRSINVFFNWAVNTMVYYGLMYGVGNLGGNLYLNTFISGAVEIPSFILMLLLLNRVGRRCTLGGALLLSGAFSFVMVAFMAEKGLPLMIAAMLGKFFISISFGVIYLYTTEIYPTIIRNVGLGAGSTCARIGGLLAPQIGELQRFWLPFPAAVFGAFSVAGGLLAFLLPESTGRELPQTVAEAENFGKDDPFTLNCFEAVKRRPSRFPMGTANPVLDYEAATNEIHSLSANQVAPTDKLTNRAFSNDDEAKTREKVELIDGKATVKKETDV